MSSDLLLYRTGCRIDEPSAGNWTLYDDEVQKLGHECGAVCFKIN